MSDGLIHVKTDGRRHAFEILAMKAPKITTLWDVVESLQARLEGIGLQDEVVDAAVVCGVESMLGTKQAPVKRRVRFSPFNFAAVAKA